MTKCAPLLGWALYFTPHKAVCQITPQSWACVSACSFLPEQMLPDWAGKPQLQLVSLGFHRWQLAAGNRLIGEKGGKREIKADKTDLCDQKEVVLAGHVIKKQVDWDSLLGQVNSSIPNPWSLAAFSPKGKPQLLWDFTCFQCGEKKGSVRKKQINWHNSSYLYW